MRNDEKNRAPCVLIVDDDPVYLLFWERILRELDISNVHTESDPKAAYELIKHIEFTLIVSDVILPGMDGFSLAKFAGTVHSDCDIILTTAYDTPLARFNPDHQRFHLLHKPYVNIEEVKKFLRHIIYGSEDYEDMSEDSFSENDEYPEVMEWKL